MSASTTEERLCSIIIKGLARADELVGSSEFDRAAAALGIVRQAQEMYQGPWPDLSGQRLTTHTTTSDQEHAVMLGLKKAEGESGRAIIGMSDFEHAPAPGLRMEVEFSDHTTSEVAKVAMAARDCGATVRVEANGLGSAFIRELDDRYNLEVSPLPKGGAS